MPPFGKAGTVDGMTLELLAQLGVLALIDSTSIGTLVIPVWLLLRPGSRRTAGRTLVYLAVVGVFYFLIGLVLLSGATGVLGAAGGTAGVLLEFPVVAWGMLLLGAGMLAWSFSDGKLAGARRTAPAVRVGGDSAGGDRVSRDSAAAGSENAGPAAGSRRPAAAGRSAAAERRWQGRIGKALDSRGGLLGLALLAGLLELPTMLPYLGAVGLLTTSGIGWTESAGVLGLYCLVMLLPGGLLVTGRLLLGSLLDGPLERLGSWLSKVSGEAVLWVVGIVGFFLVRAGLSELFPGASWNPFG